MGKSYVALDKPSTRHQVQSIQLCRPPIRTPNEHNLHARKSIHNLSVNLSSPFPCLLIPIDFPSCKTKKKRITHAAVAAKFSTLLASVIKLKQTLNTAVNAQTIPSLAVIFFTNERTMIATMGMSEEIRVLKIVARRRKYVSR